MLISTGFEHLTHYTVELITAGTFVPGQCYDPVEEQTTMAGPVTLRFVYRIYTLDRVGITIEYLIASIY